MNDNKVGIVRISLVYFNGGREKIAEAFSLVGFMPYYGEYNAQRHEMHIYGYCEEFANVPEGAVPDFYDISVEESDDGQIQKASVIMQDRG
jgi:hypothetical protein